jgi:hypothetical protein
MVVSRDKVLGIAAGLVLVLVVGVLGYAVWQANNGETSADPIVSTPAETTATPTDDARTAAERKATAAYNGYWESYVAAAAKGDSTSAEFVKYVADPLLTELRIAIKQAVDMGISYKGRPTWTPRVSAVNLAKQPYTATIEDCFDSAKWEAVYTKTGKSAVAPGQATRYVITSTVKLFDQKGWLLTDSRADRSRTC